MKRTKQFSINENKIPLLIALALSILNILIVFCSGLHKYSFEESRFTAFQLILPAALYILYIVFCIFMRAKRYSSLAKGIFCYQLVGSAAYIIYFVNFVFNTPFKEIPYSVFHAWTLIFDPIMVALGRVSGIRSKYLAAIFYLVLTFITGKTIIAIRKDIKYEKEYLEDHAHETNHNHLQ